MKNKIDITNITWLENELTTEILLKEILLDCYILSKRKNKLNNISFEQYESNPIIPKPSKGPCDIEFELHGEPFRILFIETEKNKRKKELLLE
jgi:hypothetical protein